METLVELEMYFEDECYSFAELTIGKHHASEGLVIERQNNQFLFAYSERGHLTVVKSFLTEKELVDYAFQEVSNDKWNRGHSVAWTWNEESILEAEKELNRLNISFERNDISNYSVEKHAYRIFVFGRDVLLLTDFRRTYYKA